MSPPPAPPKPERFGASVDIHARVIADCAKHLLEARPLSTDLERVAEANLRAALKGWR